MKEHIKIYSNELLCNAIDGLSQKLELYNNYNVIIQKLNNNMYELTLYKDNQLLFKVVNTIDCLYSLLDGYYRAIYDNCNLK